MPLYVILSIVFACSGLTMAGLHFAFQSKSLESRRIREEPNRKLVGRAVAIRMLASGVFSSAVIVAAVYGLYDRLFYAGPVAPYKLVLEPLVVLLVYDFIYYFMHRYPFHEWDVLKKVHAVHHRAKFPIAIDSLFLHPVENVLGLALLLGSMWMLGPIHLYSFGILFFIYSQLNIIVHCGLDLPGPLGFLARKHDKHHTSMRAGNYASLSPLPDRMFGTAD